jgi:hypothetical protein
MARQTVGIKQMIKAKQTVRIKQMVGIKQTIIAKQMITAESKFELLKKQVRERETKNLFLD